MLQPRAQRGRLKHGIADADMDDVRYERLTVQAEPAATTVRFHPRLTVIAGVGRAERELLATDLVGALAGTQTGTPITLDVVDDQGRRLSIVRPSTGKPAVRERDTGLDVTAEFAGPGGEVDLLAWLGLSLPEARRLCRVSAAGQANEPERNTVLAALACRDQESLWNAAEALVAIRDELEAQGDPVTERSSPPEPENVEAKVETLEAAAERAERSEGRGRVVALLVSIGAAAATLPAARFDRYADVPVAMLAAVAAILPHVFRRRTRRQIKARDSALESAGVPSVFSLHLRRVTEMVDHQQALARRLRAETSYAEALGAWRAMAGDISVDWALVHRQAITEAAVRNHPNATIDSLPDATPAELATWLANRLAALRQVGEPGESLPLILDEPLLGLEPSVKQWALELLGRSAGSPQVIYLTSDPEVAAWGRLEAISGEVAVFEAAPADAPEPELQGTDDLIELPTGRAV